MGAQYLSVTVDVSEAEAELVQASLYDQGALGLEVRDAETRPMPGLRAPAPGEVILVAYFDQPRCAREALARLRQLHPSARAALEEVEDQDWSNSWKSRIRPITVGRLWVGPPWERSAAPQEKVAVVVEPKMAFGTGDHPTTMLCLEALDEYLAAHPGASVLDVGTGTGVLAIAARKLGASRVVGTDNDPVAVELAQECALENLGASSIEISGASLEELPGTFDLVLANILANTLLELAPALSLKARDRLVLSGLLLSQREEVEAAYRKQGLFPHGHREMGEWLRVDLAR